MQPELFTIPFLNISIKAYGTMTVLGFLVGMLLARWRARKIGEDPERITNYALAALVLGIIGARVMYIIHYWEDDFADEPIKILQIWMGGQEFLGGFLGAIGGLFVWLKFKKRSFLQVTDILAPSLALGLALGRLGCFLNGCCYGGACDLPWAMQFPALNEMTVQRPGGQTEKTYRYSPAYAHQLYGNPQRDPEARPLLELPDEFNAYYVNEQGYPVNSLALIPADRLDEYHPVPKLPDELAATQREALLRGDHPMHPVHPTQLYAFVNALLICLVLNRLWRRRGYVGQVSAALLVLYGPTRFVLEAIRVDNPIEVTGLTVSQNLSILAVIAGVIMHITLRKRNAVTVEPQPVQEDRDGIKSGQSDAGAVSGR